MVSRDKLDEVLRAAKHARWRVETVARVSRKLGMHKSMTLPGLKLLATELARGRANPSLIFRFFSLTDPDRTAVIQAGLPGRKDLGADEIKRMSYGAINAAMDHVAAALKKRGIGKGTTVIASIKNRIESVVVQAAVGRAGASVVTASWRSTAPELEYLANHSGARAIFFDADIEGTIRDLLLKVPAISPGRAFSIGGAVTGFAAIEDLYAERGSTDEDHSKDSAVVMYTSGTTGKPKGASRSLQRDAMAYALSFVEHTPMQLGEVHLTVCPLYHATAFGFTGITFLLGGTAVIMAEYRPESFLAAVERYGVTSSAMVPTMIHRLLDQGPDALKKADLSSLRAIFSGGAPLPGSLAIEAMNALGDKIYNFYGATETGLVTLATPEDLRASPGTIGRALPGNDVRLVDEQGRDVPEGQVGELYAHNTMLVTYHADADATKRSMLDRYFSVGDLARRDAAGRYHIEGRKRDMIISGGVNVYPAEVEAAIEAHAAVAEVAVVGVPDKEWGERVRAFVVRRQGAEVDGEQIKAHCRARLASTKVPRDVVFLDALPRNPTGKILKRELRTMEIA